MGREARMVPKGWEHPTNDRGHHIPLHDGYERDLNDLQERVKKEGWTEALDYYGGGICSEKYMLVGIPESERTHYMMYETVSEGTPISPAFETQEELARWLADTGASAFGDMAASYEDWLRTIQRGSAVSAVLDSNGFRSGVAAE